MVLELIVRFIAGIGLILANAFFVMAEFGLTRARQYDESEFQDHPGLRRAWEMTSRMELHLTGCQLGISSTSVLLGIVFEPAVTEIIRPIVEPLLGFFGVGAAATSFIAIAVAVVIINLIHKVWGEQAPTYWGIEQPKRVLAATAIPLSWWTWITFPLIKLGDGLAKSTLRLFGVEMTRSWAEDADGAGDASADGEQSDGPRTELRRSLVDLLRRQDLPRDRREEVLGAVEIDDRTVEEIMVPRDSIHALSVERDFSGNADIITRHPHSRYPLIGADVDDFRGVLYLPEIFRHRQALERGEITLDDLDHTNLRVAADLPISEFIDQLQSAGEEMALIVDSDAGHVVGMATQTDAVEAVFGELRDPLDDDDQQDAKQKSDEDRVEGAAPAD